MIPMRCRYLVAFLLCPLAASWAQPPAALSANLNNPSLIPSDASVGYHLAANVSVKLNGVAPQDGLKIVLTSSDPSKLLLSLDGATAGSKQITVPVGGGYARSRSYYLYGLANSGAVTYTATAPGFASGTATVTLTPSGITTGIDDHGPTPAARTLPATTLGGNYYFHIWCSQLDSSNNPIGLQAVAGGFPTAVNITSSNPQVGTITESPLTVPAGYSGAVTQFHPVGAGETILAAGVPAGFSAPTKFGTVTGHVVVPRIMLTDGTMIGQNLQGSTSLVLGEGAKREPIKVTLTSADPSKLLLSATATGAGAASIVLTIAPGGNSASYYMQALAGSGKVNYTATADGFVSGTATVDLVPSGIVIVSPDNMPVNTSVGARKTPLRLVIVQLDPNTHKFLVKAPLAAGHTLTIDLANTNPAAGTVPASVTIGSNGDTAIAEFTPVAPGSTTISVSTPVGFTAPSQYGSVPVTVK
jgi:hypothetical protein